VRVAGRCALVTGAGSGLGRATAHALVTAGANVVMLDLSADALAKTASGLGANVRAAVADVRKPEQIEAAIEMAHKAFGPMRIVVNCAGIPSSAKLVSKGKAHDLELWNRVIDINLSGSFNVMRLAAVRMIENEPDPETGERGVIVNTASVAAFDGQKGQVAYAASKAAVAGMTLPIARDLADKAIRCISVAPGLFDTELLQHIPEKGIEVLKQSLLYPNRMGRPTEFAALVRHCIENPYLNGVCLRLDGGVRP